MIARFVIVILFSVLTVMGQTATKGNAGRTVTLRLPHNAVEIKNLWLEVKIGAEINRFETEVWSSSGRFLGIISPPGPVSHDKDAAATYTLPVPLDLLVNGELEIRLVVNMPDHTQRPPTKREVRNVKLKLVSSGRSPDK